MTTKQNKRSSNMPALEKIEAIRRVHDGESKASVARDIGVPESTLRGWCKNESKILYQSRQTTPPETSSENEPEFKKAKLFKDEFAKKESNFNAERKDFTLQNDHDRNRAELSRLSNELGLNRQEHGLLNMVNNSHGKTPTDQSLNQNLQNMLALAQAANINGNGVNNGKNGTNNLTRNTSTPNLPNLPNLPKLPMLSDQSAFQDLAAKVWGQVAAAATLNSAGIKLNSLPNLNPQNNLLTPQNNLLTPQNNLLTPPNNLLNSSVANDLVPNKDVKPNEQLWSYWLKTQQDALLQNQLMSQVQDKDKNPWFLKWCKQYYGLMGNTNLFQQPLAGQPLPHQNTQITPDNLNGDVINTNQNNILMQQLSKTNPVNTKMPSNNPEINHQGDNFNSKPATFPDNENEFLKFCRLMQEKNVLKQSQTVNLNLPKTSPGQKVNDFSENLLQIAPQKYLNDSKMTSDDVKNQNKILSINTGSNLDYTQAMLKNGLQNLLSISQSYQQQNGCQQMPMYGALNQNFLNNIMVPQNLQNSNMTVNAMHGISANDLNLKYKPEQNSTSPKISPNNQQCNALNLSNTDYRPKTPINNDLNQSHQESVSPNYTRESYHHSPQNDDKHQNYQSPRHEGSPQNYHSPKNEEIQNYQSPHDDDRQQNYESPRHEKRSYPSPRHEPYALMNHNKTLGPRYSPNHYNNVYPKHLSPNNEVYSNVSPNNDGSHRESSPKNFKRIHVKNFQIDHQRSSPGQKQYEKIPSNFEYNQEHQRNFEDNYRNGVDYVDGVTKPEQMNEYSLPKIHYNNNNSLNGDGCYETDVNNHYNHQRSSTEISHSEDEDAEARAAVDNLLTTKVTLDKTEICNSNGQSDDELQMRPEDALVLGEKFLNWLENFSNPSITRSQILQYKGLLNNVRKSLERMNTDVASSQVARVSRRKR